LFSNIFYCKFTVTADCCAIMSLNGAEGNIPPVGFGTYLCTGEDVLSSVPFALKAGYVHIDTAEGYRNEEFVGQVVNSLSSKPFITTKLWPGGMGDAHKTYEQVLESGRLSAQKLGVKCIDLYLIHLPLGNCASRLEQWRAMLTLQATGVVRLVGVSNYNVSHLEEIREAGMAPPVVNQLELHPFCQHRSIVEYCRRNNIALTAYSSLAPLSDWRTGQRSNKTDETTIGVDLDGFSQLLERVASDSRMSRSQVLLQWALQHGYGILPKSTNPDRIVQNLEVLTRPHRSSAIPAPDAGVEVEATRWAIPKADMALLDAFDCDRPFAWPIGDPCSYDK
jgi:2,5-diketo-D-gluconate reductase A